MSTAHAIEHAIVALVHRASTPALLRRGMLALLREGLAADIGIFVALEAGREVRSLDGLAPDERVVVERNWRSTGEELRPVAARAVLEGATTDRRALGSALERTKLYRRVMAPIGGTETLVLAPSVGGGASA